MAQKIGIPNGLEFSHIAQRLGGPMQRDLRRKIAYDDMRVRTEVASEKFLDNFNTQKKREKVLLDRHDGDIHRAIEDFIQPSTSKNKMLKARPFDSKIVEEIYQEQHGRRFHRQQRKGVDWEKWIARGDTHVPVGKASERAQLLFGMGGQIQLTRAARCPEEFPPTISKKQGESRSALRTLRRGCFEIPFIGRTNVGKSSLLNSLLNTHVAEYDCTPGTTLCTNFYTVGHHMRLIDTPGYGHVSPLRSPEARVEAAQSMLRAYLRQVSDGQRFCPRVIVCISSELGIHAKDKYYLEFLDQLKVPFSVVMTKTDEVPIKRLIRMTDLTRCQLVHYPGCVELMLTSALQLSGIRRLQNLIGTFARKPSDSPIELEPENVNFNRIV